MEFKTLTEEEFRLFLDKHPQKTFLQTPEIAKLREKSGWKKHYVGVFDNEVLVSATMMISKNTHFGKCEFYAPRGFLTDYNNEELLAFFTKKVKEYIKRNKGYLLRIDPYLALVERDNDAKIVEGGFDNRKVLKSLKKLGYIKKEKSEQAEWIYVLNIENKTSEEILKNMKPNTRNIIRKTKRSGLKIKILSYDELPIFEKIIVETGQRKGFPVRNINYFKQMYEIFSPRNEIKFMLVYLDVIEYISILNNEKIILQEKISKLSSSVCNDKKREEYKKGILNIDKKITEAKNLKEENGNEILLAASMFLLIQPEIIYLWSGNVEKYLKFNGQYLLQWEMIQLAVKEGYKRYNFYGIGNTFDKKDPYYGVYEFKKGFNGHVEQLIGEFVLPVDKIFYNLFKLVHKIKK